jgi:adenylate kinase
VNVIILGPQGSGKGTQADLLAERKGFVHLEMGKVLRSVADSDNQYASVVREAQNGGKLVSDEYVRLIAWDFINKHDPKTNNFVFDGYPRSVAQYELLKDMLMKFGKTVDKVINIVISEGETVRRLNSRRTCEKCGEVYNLVTNPPKTPENCDKCGGILKQREDDKPEAIKRRLAIFWETTKPVLDLAKLENIEVEINGERPIEEIYKDIEKAIGL